MPIIPRPERTLLKNLDELYKWLFNIYTNFTAQTPVLGIQFQPQVSAPVNPAAGGVYYADGVGWNPGSHGEGLYRYNIAGSWVKIG